MTIKKRILFIVPSLRRAGAETQVVDLVNNLDVDRFIVHLFTFEDELDLLERLDRGRVHFYNQPRHYKVDFSMARSIARIIDREKIEAVHCTLQIALLIGWIAVKLSRSKPPIVLALHTTINRNRKDDFLDAMIYQWLMRDCIKVICVCKAQERHWCRKYPFLKGRTTVVYNGVDTAYFDPLRFKEQGSAFRASLSIQPEDTVICCIAGLRPEKGHEILLDAFCRVRQTMKNVKLLLAGDGIMRARLERLVCERGIRTVVHLLGNVHDVRPVLAASDLSVIASTAVETFSIAMLESMSMQVPLVATNIGGTAEAIKEGETGSIVRPNDSDDLSEAILALLHNENQLSDMGIVGRRVVEAKFSRGLMVARTEHLLNAL